MILDARLYVAVSVLAGLVSLGVAAYVYRRRSPALDVRGLLVLLTTTGLSGLLFAVIVLAERVPVMLTLIDLAVLLLCLGQFGFLHFSLSLADRLDLVSRYTAAPVVAGGVLVVAAAWTNEFHRRFRADVDVYTEPARMVAVDYGVVGKLGWLYFLALTLAGTVLVLRYLSTSHSRYRAQGVLVAAGVLLPWVGSALSLAGVPHPAVNPTPVFLALAGVCYALALTRYGFLDLVPLANAAIVENVDDHALVADPTDTVVEVHSRSSELLDVDNPVGRPVDEVLPVDAPPDAGAGGYSGEVALEEGDGRRTFDLRSVPLHADDGRYLGRAITLRETTELTARERELERKNELLDEFASVVSHDIATPLGVIENKARLVELTGDPSHAEDIYEATARVQRLVDELQELARTGHRVGETSPVDLAEVTNEAWNSVCAGDATLSIDASVTVEADRDRLRQLLENLLRNSVEHGSPGPSSRARGNDHDDAGAGATADGSAAADDGSAGAGGAAVRIGPFPGGFYVADDGPGIPREDRERVFEQGFTTGEENTGLGLTIVRRIADGHGWTVDVTESDAGGARFEIRTED